MNIKIIFKHTFNYLIPLIILLAFIISSYNAHDEDTSEELISLKEFSLIAQERGNFRLSFLDTLSINVFDFIVPARFIPKKASLGLLDQKRHVLEFNQAGEGVNQCVRTLNIT
ncbi:TPA: hypothetical protein ACP9FK_003448 [Legionella anisa]|uniref:hypothetical protein n=1 Tax=Legionella anisa TaxID=28082 RepID=UPI00197D7B02|nr:hypothetical protein [Legionella anisa]MBN5937250.1 hypothetical protein [Legionella anisa]